MEFHGNFGGEKSNTISIRDWESFSFGRFQSPDLAFEIKTIFCGLEILLSCLQQLSFNKVSNISFFITTWFISKQIQLSNGLLFYGSLMASWHHHLFNFLIQFFYFILQHANNVRHAAEEYLVRRQARQKSMTRSMTTGLAGPILSMGNVHYLPAAKCGTFFARDNVSNFITWCRLVIN